MVYAPKSDGNELPMLTRITLLEAKVRLMAIVMKGFVAVIATSLIAYFFGFH
jgi:hypothetical protein